MLCRVQSRAWTAAESVQVIGGIASAVGVSSVTRIDSSLRNSPMVPLPLLLETFTFTGSITFLSRLTATEGVFVFL